MCAHSLHSNVSKRNGRSARFETNNHCMDNLKHPFIIFDRDGTLIDHVHYLSNPKQIIFKRDLIPALKDLQNYGFKFGIITNQSGVGRGIMDLEAVKKINRTINKYLNDNDISITFFLICPHTPNDGCLCRKPNTQLGIRAERDYGVCLEKSYVIGDQESDLLFGKNLGCRVIQVPGNAKPSSLADVYALSLTDAADWIIHHSHKEFF